MSDLTQDGGPAASAVVAIRPITPKNQVVISHSECEMMLTWAQECPDPANGKRLLHLIKAFSRST